MLIYITVCVDDPHSRCLHVSCVLWGPFCYVRGGGREKKLLALVSVLCLPAACPIPFLKAINSGRFSKEHVNDAAAASSSILQLHNTKNTQAYFHDKLTECTSFHVRTLRLDFGAHALSPSSHAFQISFSFFFHIH